jgi:PST family polysaccharide transporter
VTDEAPPASLTNTVLRGVGLAGAGYFASQLLTLASYLVLARLTTPTEFGKFAAGSILIGIGTLFAESGMVAALIHRRDRLAEAAATAFVASLAAGVALAALALAFSPVVGWFFHSGEITLVAAAMSGYLVLRQSTIVPDALLQRRFSFVRRGVVEPAAIAAFGISAAVACAHGAGVWGLVLGTYASVLMQILLSWTFAGWRPELSLVSFAIWRELVGFGRHIVAGEFVRRARIEIGTVLVGRFLSPASLGSYYYAQRVAARPLAALVDSTSYVLFPAFARISRDDTRFRKAFLRALRWISVVAFPASLALFPFGEPLMVLLFGDEWRNAGYALTAMCAYAGGHALDSLASEVFKASGRPNFIFRMQVVSAVLTVALMVPLLQFGLIGVATAVSLTSIGVATYAVRTVARVIGVPVRRLLREIWPPAVAAVTMAVVMFPIEHLLVQADRRGTALGLLLLAIEALAALVLYFAILAIVAPATTRALVAAARTAGLRLRHGRTGPPQTPPSAVNVSVTRKLR